MLSQLRPIPLLLVGFVVLFAAAAACDKSNSGNPTPNAPADTSDEETPPPDGPPSTGSAPYSGRWLGTITVTDVDSNACIYPDKLVETTQGWTVQGDSVQVAELIAVNSERRTYYWRGTIRNDTLQMESKRYERCPGGVSLRQLRLKAPIKMVNNTYRLEGFSAYKVCEPNCVIELAYQLRKE